MAVSKKIAAALALAGAALLAGCGAPQRKPSQLAPQPAAPVASHPRAVSALPAPPAAGSGPGGYYLDDGPEEKPPAGLRDVPDAVVKTERLSKYANRPYAVFGKTYVPMSDVPFSQRGVASWYGKKFHGQRTASGELYDMYKMTAAHPTLPIPSYARITSLSSGVQVIVRINDRGPFHSNRIVDVSYTAALKLGLLSKGSHDVQLERLMPGDRVETASAPLASPAAVAALMREQRMVQQSEARGEVAAAPTPRAASDGYFLQLGAFSQAVTAADARSRVLASGAVTLVEVVPAGALHRLYGGPFGSRAEALAAARMLPAALEIKPIVVRRSAD